jgi:protein-disulfide isomerase/rhodanese-related sulfurtransferase
MPAFGILMYVTLALALLAEPMTGARVGSLLRRAVVGISGAGVLASLYLTFLEAFVIHAWCMWCVVQAISVTMVFVFSLRARVDVDETSDDALWSVRRQSLTLLAAIVIGTPAFLLLQHKTKVAPAALPAVSEQAVAEHLLRPDSHAQGDPNAPVTVIEFGDLQCPSCAAANQPTHEIQARFGPQVRFVFRHFPMPQLHPYALKAAEASECAAEQGKFWQTVDRYYASEGKLDTASLRRYASELGLDVNRFDTCLNSGAMAARVRRDAEDGRFLGVRSTPTFIIGHQMIEGAVDADRFAQVIRAEMPRAVAPVTATTAPAAVPADKAVQDKPSVTPTAKLPAAKSKLPVAAQPAIPAATKPASPSITTGLPGFQTTQSPFALLQGSSGCGTQATGPEAQMVHTREAQELFRQKSLFVDVRSHEDFQKARIAGAVNIPVSEVERHVKDLPRNKTIVLYEAGHGSGNDSCAVSKAAARVLLARGFQKVKVYQDGLHAWEKEGLPLQH